MTIIKELVVHGVQLHYLQHFNNARTTIRGQRLGI